MMNSSISNKRNTMNYSQMKVKKDDYNPFDLTETEMEAMKKKQLNSKAMERLQNRDDEIKRNEDYINSLKDELQSQKKKLNFSTN